MFAATASIVSKLQLLALIVVLTGSLVVNFTSVYLLLALITFYVFNIVGISITLHRYYSHKSFEFKYNAIKSLFTFISVIVCRGSPIGWVYIHRLHHGFSDTDKDPHSPKHLGFKLFGLKHLTNHSDKINKFLVKDLMTEEQLNINKYYLLYVIAYVTTLAVIDIQLVYFLWALPVVLVQLSQNSFNYFGHMIGYRNFQTEDASTNNVWLFPFILGDAWHNNHHKNPALISNKIRDFEIDPAAAIINIIKK
jgi:stearoyl-CoA desaturase (delta-9 desaturase)